MFTTNSGLKCQLEILGITDDKINDIIVNKVLMEEEANNTE